MLKSSEIKRKFFFREWNALSQAKHVILIFYNSYEFAVRLALTDDVMREYTVKI